MGSGGGVGRYSSLSLATWSESCEAVRYSVAGVVPESQLFEVVTLAGACVFLLPGHNLDRNVPLVGVPTGVL